ncbi:MAG: type IV pilus assembly protein PilC [Parcubacteria bacterium C7867-006]|nr:MAG: type IV pilus assembly protein PilC [Parcubacteria bacterium C7867-006]
MIFSYKAINKEGTVTQGTVEAFNVDIAIKQLQATGLVISEIHGEEDKNFKVPILSIFNKVSNKDVVIMSRQIATLFSAQVSALRVFRLLSGQTDNPLLRKYLTTIADDIQGGSSISIAISKFPDTFSNFYINMVKSGEESGKLDEVFNYLADYLDRTYEVTSKARSALIYPAFVIFTFFAVMVLMLTVIIPKIAMMITDSGQDVPIYTKIVLLMSGLFVNYGIFLAVGLVIFGFMVWRYSRTTEGAVYIDKVKLEVPYIGDLYKKLYLSRIADNLNTMIISGIPILKALEITSSVVDNIMYRDILNDALIKVKEGTSLSNALSQHKEIPNILTQMVKVGEETGELGNILKSLAKFYQREVTTAVDTLVGLIEPVMIVLLGLGVGVLLAAVLMPIYNIAAAS